MQLRISLEDQILGEKLLPHFQWKGKKNINLRPPTPLNNKKKKEINQGAPFPPSHNEYNINPGPFKQ
jgi:hypothetical protein